jgi:hypothetical protein
MGSLAQLILPLIAVLLCLAISVNIIALTIVAPALTNYGQYSSRQHTEYAVISTLLATLLTRVIVSRIRQLWVPLSYIITGLITTAIVASVTPSPGTKTVPYSPLIPNDEPNLCSGADTINVDYGYWNSSGKIFNVNPEAVACPLQTGLTVMGGVNIIGPTTYTYADKNAAVRGSVLGSPAGIYDADGAFGYSLSDLLGQYGTSALSTQPCVL